MPLNRRVLLRGLLGSFGLTMPTLGHSSDDMVVIVSSDASAAYAEAAQAALEALQRSGLSRYDIRQMTAAELAEAHRAGSAPQPRVFLALGSQAVEVLAQDTAAWQLVPVLCALVPRGSFERIARQRNPKAANRFSAIYLDQPWRRQLALIRLALPQAQRLGVLWGPESVARATALRSLAKSEGFSLAEAQVEPQQGIFVALKQVLDAGDALLAVPDALVYNSNSIQSILLAAMRKLVPVVAFSPAYVRAGALMALYQTPTQAGQQAAGLLLDVLRGRSLPAIPIESSDFEVGVNRHVASALNLDLDPQALRLALRRQEHLP